MGRFCGNCGAQLEADSRFCSQCGKSIEQAGLLTPEVVDGPRSGGSRKSEFDCPRCGSNHTRKISNILVEGRTTSSMTGKTTVASEYGGYLEGGVVLEGESMNGLANKFLQDRPGGSYLSAAMIWVFFLLVALFYFALSFIPMPKSGGFVLGLVLFFTILIVSWAITSSMPMFKEEIEQTKANQAIYESWMSTGFFCRRCANVFIPGSKDEYPYKSLGNN